MLIISLIKLYKFPRVDFLAAKSLRMMCQRLLEVSEAMRESDWTWKQKEKEKSECEKDNQQLVGLEWGRLIDIRTRIMKFLELMDEDCWREVTSVLRQHVL